MQIAPELAAFSQDTHTKQPDRLGQRYTATQFLPEAGNTVVCALDFDNPDHELILDARAQVMALPQADRFLFTPARSLHMTVFEGVIETRRTADAWPAGMDRTLAVDTVTQSLLGRLQTFRAPPAFDVGIKALRPTGLLLAGASYADEATMRAWRDALTEPFGFRHQSHDSYRFHMTFGYPTAWLTPDVLPDWQAALTAIARQLQETLPRLPLKTPAFCEFADMTAFPSLRVLAQ